MKFKNLLLVTFSFVFMTFQSCSKNEEIFARQEILANIENNNITVGADYKVLAADGIGAAGAFTSYGLLAGFTGPMGIGALMGTVAFSAAWSSGCTALGIG